MMLDQRSYTFCTESFLEAHIVGAFVGSEAPQGDLRADVRPVWSLRPTVNADNRALRGIDKECGLNGLCLTVTATEGVT